MRQLSRDKKAFRCIQPGSLVCTPNQSFKTALACRCPAGTRKQTSRDRRTFACVTPAPRAPAAPRNISALERNLHAKRFKATRRQFSNNSQRMVTIKHDLSFVATMGGCRLGFDHFRITSLKTVFGGSGFISMNQRGCVEIRGDVMRFIVHQKCTGRTNSSRLCRMQRVRPFVFAQTRFKVFRDGIRVNFAGQVLNFAFVKVLGRR